MFNSTREQHPHCRLQTVNQLAMETSRVMRGSHSRKTAAFVRVSGRSRERLITAGHRTVPSNMSDAF